MKIVVTGLRGFPDIQGGVERHSEELYPRIANLGQEIIVSRRSNFITDQNKNARYDRITFIDISAPHIVGLESALHTLKSVLYAKRIKADLVHIHAVGPSIAVPLAKLLGLKVVVTHHGPDYDREKWGFFAKFILQLGECFAALFADRIIVISDVIKALLKRKYNRTKGINLIYNGISTFPKSSHTNYIESLGLKKEKYVLAVGRFVEEKRLDKLIEAFVKLEGCKDFQLVIAGGSDYKDSYSLFLKGFALENQVVLTGIIKGEKLAELYKNAALFVIPSSHEGLPITLLEAMSFNKKVIASNIPANLEVGLPKECYFELNDIEELSAKIAKALKTKTPISYDLKKYNWDTIAKQVLDVYNMIL